MHDDTAHPVVVAFPPLDGRSASGTHQWFVASVRPRFEDKAAERINALGFGTFLPLAQQTYTKRRYRWGRWYEEKRAKTVKAFPTYVFVCFDPANPSWRRIPNGQWAKASGFRHFFGEAEAPRAVPHTTMARLMLEAQDRAMTPKQVQALVEIGIAYRVTEGPLAGHIGACEAVQGETVRLGLTIFGRSTPTSLPVAHVERVEA